MLQWKICNNSGLLKKWKEKYLSFDAAEVVEVAAAIAFEVDALLSTVTPLLIFKQYHPS